MITSILILCIIILIGIIRLGNNQATITSNQKRIAEKIDELNNKLKK